MADRGRRDEQFDSRILEAGTARHSFESPNGAKWWHAFDDFSSSLDYQFDIAGNSIVGISCPYGDFNAPFG
jgi:hypothetical protein